MTGPDVALVFTPEPWVEALHRHLTDHGGARVLQVVVDPGIALEEHYEILVVSHRWPALTRGFVEELAQRGRRAVGVYDGEEPASREHLVAVGVAHTVDAGAGPDGIARAIIAAAAAPSSEPRAIASPVATRAGDAVRVVVGGPPGTGRTEVAIELARALQALLVDADDVAPAVAPRLACGPEPNLRSAIDAVEHGRGSLDDAIVAVPGLSRGAVVGLASARAWSQVHPGEVARVLDRLRSRAPIVVVDGAGLLEEDAEGGRSRFALARAVVRDADVLVAVCDASPVGVVRLASWLTQARILAPEVPAIVLVNRAPGARFRRAELFGEILGTLPATAVEFAAYDTAVTRAAWDGVVVGRGAFRRGVAPVARAVADAARAHSGVSITVGGDG